MDLKPAHPAEPQDPAYYERVAEELEEIATMLRQRPEMNHGSAERLFKIAANIREDAGLIPRNPTRN